MIRGGVSADWSGNPWLACGTYFIDVHIVLDLSELEKASLWVAMQIQTDRAFHWSNAKTAFQICIEKHGVS
jgi:hypothetical protein